MAQEPIEIKEHIDAERERLGYDIEEIEHRVKNAFDWRSWYESNTVLMLGAAAAGGLLVSMVIDRDKQETNAEEYYGPAGTRPEIQSLHSQPRKNSQLSKLGDVLENTFAALIGVGAAKFQDYVSEIVPGFREQYQTVERNQFGR
jgi:hypothetical protein